MDFRLLFEYGLAFLTIFVSVFFLLLFLENLGKTYSKPKQLKKLPFVTFIIPAFNEEKTIAKTIESVLESDYPKDLLQVIVVDDGSVDATSKIAKSFGKRVLLLRQKNGGKGRALNNGLAHARGEFIATLDADSFVEKDALRKALAHFDDEKIGAVASTMKVWEPKNVLEKLQGIEYVVTIFNRRLLSFINGINVTPGPLSVFRATVFKELGGYDEKNLLEDQEMALRIQSADYKIASAMDAVVYTRVPPSLRALVKQRVRWQRGGLRNILKHYYLVSPRYGDFGLWIMPLGILSIFLLFAVFFFAFSTLFSGRFLTDFMRYGFSSLWLGLSPLHVLSLIILFATIAWSIVGLKSIEERLPPVFYLALYVVVYAPLITLFWLVTLVAEVKREKLRW